MNPAKLIALCAISGIAGHLAGPRSTSPCLALEEKGAHKAGSQDDRERKEIMYAREATVVRANRAAIEGSGIARPSREKMGRWIPLDPIRPQGFRSSLYRGGKLGVGYVRDLLSVFDWTNVKAESASGGVPGKMIELADKRDKILAEEGFALVAGDGWSHDGEVYPQLRVTAHDEGPGSGDGNGGYTLLLDAKQLVHVRVYTGRSHAASVIIRQEYESAYKTLTVETYFVDPGAVAALDPIELKVWETFDVKKE